MLLLIYFHKRESKRVLSFSLQLHHNPQCWQYFRHIAKTLTHK